MITRLFMTVGALIGAAVLHGIWSPVATLIGGQAAGGQFLPSDAAALQTAYTLGGLRAIDGFIGIGLSVILLLLWVGPLVRFFKTLDDEQRNIGMLLAVAFGGMMLMMPQPAQAFYQTTETLRKLILYFRTGQHFGSLTLATTETTRHSLIPRTTWKRTRLLPSVSSFRMPSLAALVAGVAGMLTCHPAD
jgi:hypothetical protein